MPEIRYFEVEETRVVRVAANNAVNACVIAQAAFDHGQNSNNGVMIEKAPVGIWGNTMTKVRTTGLTVDEER